MMVPIVSKKSESMTEKIASSAVTVPRRVKKPKSIRPNVEKSGVTKKAYPAKRCSNCPVSALNTSPPFQV